MSNPGVITLTRTKVCGQDLKIEDNLGESIHIHYGQIRIDLSVEEFEKLETAAEYILDQMNELIQVNNIGWRDLNPIFLQNPKNTNILYKLQKAYVTTVKLKDIYVDAYVRLPLVGRVPMYRSLKYSKVVKALAGKCNDNNNYKQLNEIFETNSERVKKNMDSIKKDGYPVNGQYIILNKDNMIIDGQHRSACLYCIYGPNYEVPVMKWEFEDDNHIFFPKKKSVPEIAIRAYVGLIRRGASGLIRLPLWGVSKLKNLSHRTKRQMTIKKDIISVETPVGAETDIFSLLTSKGIPFIKLDSDVMTLKAGADTALLVDSKYKCCFEECMLRSGFAADELEKNSYEYLYSLEKDGWYSNGRMKVHVFYQMLCKSFYEPAFLPISQNIEKTAWSTRQYYEEQKCFQLNKEVKLLLLLIQCVYFEKSFTEKRKKQLSEYIEEANLNILREMLYEVFYGFTDRLMILVNNNLFDDVLEEYRCFKKY